MSSKPVVQQHFCTFYSPGTFVSEQTTIPVERWDVEAAKLAAIAIVERHGATPYGFRFSTRGRGAHDLDSKEIDSSGLYWLGGTVRTLAEVEADNLPDESILRSNMRGNNYAAVVTNDNSWRFTAPLNDGDTVLDWTPPKRDAAENTAA